MIVEMTSLAFFPPTFDDLLDGPAAQGFALAAAHLPLIAEFRAASGDVSRLLQFAVYDDYAHRDRALAALAADRGWRAFRREHHRGVRGEERTILNVAAISPLQTTDDVAAAIARGAERKAPMLFELRTYTARPGRMPEVMAMLRDEGNPLTHQFVEWPVAYFTAETGLANRVMMLWAYADASERAARKARMLPDPRFQELGSRFNSNFAEQRSDLLMPLPHSPLR